VHVKGRGWCSGGFVALAAGISLAVAPRPPVWVDFGSPAPAMARAQVIDSGGSGLTIAVVAPGFIPGIHEDSNRHFASLTMPGDGYLSAVGKPALPVIRRLLVVPDNATVSVAFTGHPLMTSLFIFGLPAQVWPVQSPVPKIPGAAEAAPFEFNSAQYSSSEVYPASPVSLTEAGTLFGHRLLCLEVCPFATVPSTGSLAVYTNMVVAVTFAKEQVRTDDVALTAREQHLLEETVLNPPRRTEMLVGAEKRLLIIAPNSFTNRLDSYIAHKTSRGWLVDCFGTNSTGSTSSMIRAFIKARYANSATRPTALLLVGDTAQIPRFIGVTSEAPDTDLYYGCMDGGSDWLPEFPVGRFSVATSNQLEAVLEKTMAHESSHLDPWIKNAVFMASEDNHAVSEGTHNDVISGTLAPRGFACEKLYCYSSNASPGQVLNAFNAGCVLGLYSGHGTVTGWEDGPRITQSDVASLTNVLRYPVICSFACLTGMFSIGECFAETWLRVQSRGAVAILASSVTSYWNEDDILEKSFIAALCDESQPTLGAVVWRAKQKYLAIYGTSTTTRRYFEQYNLLGDPTLEIAGFPVLTNGIPVAWFTSQGITNTNYMAELDEDRDSDGMTAWQEYLAGTLPGDATSVLRILDGKAANGITTLRWLSAPSLLKPMPLYQVWFRTNLSSGVWLQQTNHLLRTPPTNEVLLAIPPDSDQLFYRVTLTN